MQVEKEKSEESHLTCAGPSEARTGMDPEVKARWVAALRSGEYTQQRDGVLRSAKGFCCLGVLCDLHSRETGAKWAEHVYLESQACLPEKVRTWAGTEDEFGGYALIHGSKSYHLSAHNDTDASFAEIADAIEAQL